jgi:hypothetical protein
VVSSRSGGWFRAGPAHDSGPELDAQGDGLRLHPDHEVFVAGLNELRKVVLVSREDDGGRAVRTCAPLDYGPCGGGSCYHFWDYEKSGPEPRHMLILRASQIYAIDLTREPFDPAGFAPWDHIWTLPRDWGEFS